MSMSKPLNKKSFYAGMEAGEAPDIAMPNLEQPSPISTAAPNPWESEFAEPPQAQAAAPEPEEPDEQEESDEVEEAPQELKRPGKEAPREENMKYLRLAREKAERERDEMMQMLQMQMRQQQPQQQQAEPEYDDFGLEPDALVEGKNLKKVSQKMRAIEEQLKSYQQQSAQAIMEAKIHAQFPDFEKVVSVDNVEILNAKHPAIAKMLRNTPDMYEKAAAAYQVIKEFGIHRDPIVERDHMRAVKNLNKPKPLASVNPQQGDSPLSKANAFANGEFTSEIKEKLRKEMYAARKSL